MVVIFEDLLILYINNINRKTTNYTKKETVMKKILQVWDYFMNSIEWYIIVVTNWSPQGTLRRHAYVKFAIINMIVALGFLSVDKLTGLYSPYWSTGPFYLIYTILILWPGFCAAAQRLRDAGYSAHRLWWLLLPIVGGIMCIWWVFQPSRMFPHNSKKALQLS
jgi:uncharacterized membrane protein YhaH (DUF805 family)